APLSRPLLLVAVIGGALVAAALGLWAYYGTAVFFEMVRAGWLAGFLCKLRADDGTNVANCPHFLSLSDRPRDFRRSVPLRRRQLWRRLPGCFCDRRTVQARRPEWKSDHGCGSEGKAAPGILRLYALPRRLPDHAF